MGQRIAKTVIAALTFGALFSVAACTTTPDAGVHVRPSSLAQTAAVAEPATVYIAECLPSELVREPETLTLACADGNEWLEGLSWTSWGSPQAAASGVLVSNSCDPTCAAGTMERFDVNVVATALTVGTEASLYRRLELTAVKDAPAWMGTPELYDLMGANPEG